MGGVLGVRVGDVRRAREGTTARVRERGAGGGEAEAGHCERSEMRHLTWENSAGGADESHGDGSGAVIAEGRRGKARGNEP